MKLEKLILSFFAVLIGLIVAGAAFYFYQSSKSIPENQIKKISLTTPTPTTAPVTLVIDNPRDLSVVDNKTVSLSGHTDPGVTIIVSTSSNDQVITPSNIGAFSTTITISSDENYIRILAINPSGQEAEKTLTVTYSTESF